MRKPRRQITRVQLKIVTVRIGHTDRRAVRAVHFPDPPVPAQHRLKRHQIRLRAAERQMAVIGGGLRSAKFKTQPEHAKLGADRPRAKCPDAPV